MDEAFTELSGYRRIVDDVVIYENDPTVHTDHVRQFLQQCTEQKITLNPEKVGVHQKTGQLCNIHTVSTRLLHRWLYHLLPHPSKPQRSSCFFGLANQLSASTADLTNISTWHSIQCSKTGLINSTNFVLLWPQQTHMPMHRCQPPRFWISISVLTAGKGDVQNPQDWP